MRVENQKHFGMHCVGKQCLDITMATCYNKQLPVVTAASMHGLTTFVGYFSKISMLSAVGWQSLPAWP